MDKYTPIVTANGQIYADRDGVWTNNADRFGRFGMIYIYIYIFIYIYMYIIAIYNIASPENNEYNIIPKPYIQ